MYLKDKCYCSCVDNILVLLKNHNWNIQEVQAITKVFKTFEKDHKTLLDKGIILKEKGKEKGASKCQKK